MGRRGIAEIDLARVSANERQHGIVELDALKVDPEGEQSGRIDVEARRGHVRDNRALIVPDGDVVHLDDEAIDRIDVDHGATDLDLVARAEICRQDGLDAVSDDAELGRA